jgi:hypothetical protein
MGRGGSRIDLAGRHRQPIWLQAPKLRLLTRPCPIGKIAIRMIRHRAGLLGWITSQTRPRSSMPAGQNRQDPPLHADHQAHLGKTRACAKSTNS